MPWTPASTATATWLRADAGSQTWTPPVDAETKYQRITTAAVVRVTTGRRVRVTIPPSAADALDLQPWTVVS